MSEQWEVMWWSSSGPAPGAPKKAPEGWEPFGALVGGIWLRRRVQEPVNRAEAAPDGGKALDTAGRPPGAATVRQRPNDERIWEDTGATTFRRMFMR